MSVARGTLINLVTRIVSVALGLGLTLITARLGTTEQGSFALFTTVESALLMLTSGFGVVIAHRISHYQERPGALVGAAVIANVALGSLAAVVLAWMSASGPVKFQHLWVLAWAAPFMFIASNLSGLWLGIGQMAAMARITLATPMLALLGIGICSIVQEHIDLISVLMSWVGARVLVSLSVLIVAVRDGWVGRPSFAVLRRELSFVATIGFTNLLGLLNYRIDLFLVEHFLGLSFTGVYSVAVLVAELLWLVSSSVTQAAYSRIGTPNGVDAGRTTIRVIHISLLALIVLCIPLWAAAALVLPAALGDEYAAAVPLLAILLPGVLAYGGASALSAYFTNHAGRPLIPAALAAFSLVLNIVLSFFLIPYFGAAGAAFSTSASYVISIGVSGWIFSKLAATSARSLLRPDWISLRDDLKRLRALIANHAS